MKIGCGYRNALGNFVIFTSVLQALDHHSGGPVDLILDEEWNDDTRDSIELMVKYMPFVNKIVNYPSEYVDKYDYVHMSTHSVYDKVADKFMSKEIDDLPEWAVKFYHEKEFYYMELVKKLGYKGPMFKQYFPSSGLGQEKLNLSWIPNGIWICVANGYQRTNSGKWSKKAYKHWDVVINELSKLYPEAIFILIGGKDDVGWAKRIEEKTHAISLVGSLNIIQTSHVLSYSDLLLSTDTAVAHVADAIEVPSIVLYGCSLVSKNGLLESESIPVISPMECSGCQSTTMFETCVNTRCMEAIEPRYIIAATRKLLR